jgi:hypothetical protein
LARGERTGAGRARRAGIGKLAADATTVAVGERSQRGFAAVVGVVVAIGQADGTLRHDTLTAFTGEAACALRVAGTTAHAAVAEIRKEVRFAVVRSRAVAVTVAADAGAGSAGAREAKGDCVVVDTRGRACAARVRKVNGDLTSVERVTVAIAEPRIAFRNTAHPVDATGLAVRDCPACDAACAAVIEGIDTPFAAVARVPIAVAKAWQAAGEHTGALKTEGGGTRDIAGPSAEAAVLGHIQARFASGRRIVVAVSSPV